MHLAILGRFYGSDNIVRYTGTRNHNHQSGDLILIGGNYAIVLGEKVARGCDYEINKATIHLAEKAFLSLQSINMCHWMVRERYSSYRKVLPLRVTNDIESLLKRKPQTPPSTQESGPRLVTSGSSRSFSDEKHQGQQCLVFPDLWTITSSTNEKIRKQKNVAILTSTMTEKQKNDTWRAIKNGSKNIILTTPGNMFCDRHNLADIRIIDPHLRYHKNRQNPRFSTEKVVEKIQEHIIQENKNYGSRVLEA